MTAARETRCERVTRLARAALPWLAMAVFVSLAAYLIWAAEHSTVCADCTDAKAACELLTTSYHLLAMNLAASIIGGLLLALWTYCVPKEMWCGSDQSKRAWVPHILLAILVGLCSIGSIAATLMIVVDRFMCPTTAGLQFIAFSYIVYIQIITPYLIGVAENAWHPVIHKKTTEMHVAGRRTR